MFLRARILDKPGAYDFYVPVYSSIKIVTTDPIAFKRWCWKQGFFFYISRNPGMCEVFDDNFYSIKYFFHTAREKPFIEMLEKKWGYYDPHYDKLDWFGRLVYDIKYHMGVFQNPLKDYYI